MALDGNGIPDAWKTISSLKDFKKRRNLCMMQDPEFLINLEENPEGLKSKYSYKDILK